MHVDLTHLPPALQWIFLIAAILTALGVIFAVLRKAWPAFAAYVGALSRFVSTMNAIGDLPQFMVTTAHTLADQDRKIEEIHHEVQFNNGSSVKDAVTRVENVLTANTKKLTTQLAAQRRIEIGVKGLYARVDVNEKAAVQDRADIAAARQELEDTRPNRTTNPKEQH